MHPNLEIELKLNIKMIKNDVSQIFIRTTNEFAGIDLFNQSVCVVLIKPPEPNPPIHLHQSLILQIYIPSKNIHLHSVQT